MDATATAALIIISVILGILILLAGLTLLAASAIVFIAGASSASDPNEVEIDPNAEIMERYKNKK